MILKDIRLYQLFAIITLLTALSCHGLGSTERQIEGRLALIPYPAAVTWGSGYLNLKNGVEIVANSEFVSESKILNL